MTGCLAALIGATCVLLGATATDGDTVRVAGQGYRLWGIQAAETHEPGGPEATAALAALIAGQPLACRRMQRLPSYNRPVVACELPDGRDLGAEMIRSRLAVEWCRYSRNAYGTCP
jgi:endonuclease YncB( thermonuclease family)